MARRALWSGTVSFGLVAIPVALTPAVRPQRVSFHLLHDSDHARLERRLVCPADKTVVHPEHIVRGVQVEPERFIIVRGDEMDALEPDRSQTIEIEAFAELDAIDPIYYDRPYYLVPAGAQKPYRLLVQTLEQSRKVGIAKFVMHQREYLCALRSMDGALVLLTLHYSEDLVDADEVKPAAKPGAATVKQMRKLIDELSGEFDPSSYEDPYQQSLRDLVKRKQDQKGTVHAPATGEEAQPVEEGEEGPISSEDLLAALQGSLERARGKRRRKSA